MREQADLPYVDEHALTIAAPRAEVWVALERFVAETLGEPKVGLAGRNLVGRILGTDPPSGFAVAERVQERKLGLAGRHRFAQYRLVFELDDDTTDATVLRAVTHAIFPGARGRVYRALVIGTRLHVLATRGMLHAVRRRIGR